jgi:hypothetical protein
VNCCVDPTANVGEPGETEMAVSALTFRVTVPVMPLKDAVTVVAPEATPVATPDELMVATAELALDHCAVAVTFCLEPSL